MNYTKSTLLSVITSISLLLGYFSTSAQAIRKIESAQFYPMPIENSIVGNSELNGQGADYTSQAKEKFFIDATNDNSEDCATSQLNLQLLEESPILAQKLIEAQSLIRNQQEATQNHGNPRAGVIKTIPVVFHIIHTNGSENISNAQIDDAIENLNEFYRREPGSPGFGNGVDTEFEFFLAQKDPNGNCHSGVNRIYSSLTDHVDTDAGLLKGLIQWDPNRYLNFWVVKTLIYNGNPMGGYSTFPWYLNSMAEWDGIVIRHNRLGEIGTGFGAKTSPHEVGHWLGLLHTFEGGCAGGTASDCGGAGDYVCDTPPVASSSSNSGCPTGNNSCSNDVPNLPDQIANYMDYSSHACRDMFSQGQMDRMHAATEIFRKDIYSPSTLALTGYGGCNPLAQSVPDFIAEETVIYAGTTTSFTDLSSNQPSSWLWTFEGGTPASSTQKNPANILFDSPGSYNVTLSAGGSSPVTKTNYILANPTPSCDSIANISNAEPIGLYTIPADPAGSLGWVSGHDAYGDPARAEYFDNYAPYTHIIGASVVFGYATTSEPATDIITLTLWDATGAGGSPGAIVATKDVLVTDIIANAANYNPYSMIFDNPVVIPGNFFLGFQFYYPNNTITAVVAIVTSQQGAYSPGNGWIQFSDNTWFDYQSAVGVGLNHFIKPITTDKPPVSQFTENATSGCEDLNVLYNANTSTDVVSYSWDFPGGSPSTSSLMNPVITYPSAGIFDVSLTGAGSCGSSSTNLIAGYIEIYADPVFSVSPTSTTIATGGSVDASISGGDNYLWNPMTGVTITGSNTATLTPDSTLTYEIIGTNSDGCVSSQFITITVDPLTGLESIDNMNQARIKYNATTELLNIFILAENPGAFEFAILNSMGQQIIGTEKYIFSGSDNSVFSLEGYAAGVYFVQLKGENQEVYTEKILKPW